MDILTPEQVAFGMNQLAVALTSGLASIPATTESLIGALSIAYQSHEALRERLARSEEKEINLADKLIEVAGSLRDSLDQLAEAQADVRALAIGLANTVLEIHTTLGCDSQCEELNHSALTRPGVKQVMAEQEKCCQRFF